MDEPRPDELPDEFDEPSAARFRRFEKVLVTDKAGRSHRGTVL
jgi:hypothetical protein